MVSAKDAGLVPQEAHNAVSVEMCGHMSIHCSQWVIQQVAVLVL